MTNYLQGSTSSVKRCFVKKLNDRLSSPHAVEVSQKHGTNGSQEQFSSHPVEQLKCWYSLRLRGKDGNTWELSDISKVSDSKFEMEMQDNEVSNQAKVFSVEMKQQRKDKSLSACPRPTELLSKAEKQNANYISKLSDAKIPYMSPWQKLDLYLQKTGFAPSWMFWWQTEDLPSIKFEFAKSWWSKASIIVFHQHPNF